MDFFIGILLILLFAGWVVFMIVSLITENQLIKRIKKLERRQAALKARLLDEENERSS